MASTIEAEVVSRHVDDKNKKPVIPLLLRFREKIGGKVQVNPQCSDDSTYMGSTQCPFNNGVPDYQSD